jgi:hypothetical protein
MGFMNQLKNRLRAFMVGRNGADRLSMAMLWLGIALLVLAMMLSSFILNVVAMLIYLLAILRVFSKNVARRSAENSFYVNKTLQIKKAIQHRRNRFKNRRQYRYFKCPECKSWLRLPRSAGQVKVTCGKCGRQFSYIAK